MRGARERRRVAIGDRVLHRAEHPRPLGAELLDHDSQQLGIVVNAREELGAVERLGGRFSWVGGALARLDVEERLPELADLERLADVTIHAGLEAALAVAAHRKGGHGDNWDVGFAAALARADRRGRLEAVELGHLDVHEDEIERVALERVEDLAAVPDDGDAVPLPFQQMGDEGLIDGVVLGEQNAEALRRGRSQLSAGAPRPPPPARRHSSAPRPGRRSAP